jgi:hypothetical protein
LKIFINRIILLILFFTATHSQAAVKTAIYWTSPVMSKEAVSKIAKFDLAIIDIENYDNNYGLLDAIKKLNPKIKLIAYFNSMEVFEPQVENRPWQAILVKEIRQNYPSWLLKTGSGRPAIFYKGMVMLNLSATCPKIKGLTYGEWLATQIVNKLKTGKIWDGCFLDNCTPKIAWLSKQDQLDANNDGRPDSPDDLDQNWSNGYHRHLLLIREAMGKNFIMIGNKGVTEFMDILDGRMFENFPNSYLGDAQDHGWWQCLANAHQTGKYTIIQAKEIDLELAVCSAALLDQAYIAVGQNNTRWYDAFDQQLNNGEDIVITKKFRNGVKIEITPRTKKAVITNE